MRLWCSMWDSNPHLTGLKSVASTSWANRAYWRQEWDSNPRVNISIDTEVFKTTRLWPDLRTLPFYLFLADFLFFDLKVSNWLSQLGQINLKALVFSFKQEAQYPVLLSLYSFLPHFLQFFIFIFLWWIQKESNLRRVGLQPTALPTELWIQMVGTSGLEPASDDYKSSALTDWAMPQY